MNIISNYFLLLTKIHYQSRIHLSKYHIPHTPNSLILWTDLTRPIKLIKRQLILAIFQMNQPFQNMGLKVIFGIFYRPGHVELAFGSPGPNQIQT